MESDTISTRIKLFLGKWKKDYAFKTIVSSIISFSVTVLFALYHGFLGIHLSSIWHGSFVFLSSLVAIRGMILLTEKGIQYGRTGKRTPQAQNFSHQFHYAFGAKYGIDTPNFIDGNIEKPVNMGQIPAIAMAAYTTYKLTMAFVHIQKKKRSKFNNALVVELRTINFIDALVSILTLQNTLIMVNQTESSANNMLTLSAISSAAIYIVILFTTVRLLVKGFKQVKKQGRFS